MAKPQIDLKFGADLKDFRKGISNIDRSLKNLSGGFTALGATIGASFAVDAIRQFVSESVQLGATMEGVRGAFERFAEPGTLDNLRDAVAGTVDDLKLMQMAVRAKNFKIPMDVLAKGLRFAQQRAVETGESVDYLVESFVIGLGRESVKILDNLGISTLEIQRKTKEMGDMTTAVGAIMDEEFSKAGDRVVTTSMKIDQQRAAVANLKTEIGERLAPAYMSIVQGGLEFVNAITNTFDNFVEGYTEMFRAIGLLKKEQDRFGDSISETGKKRIQSEEKSLFKLNAMLSSLRDANLEEDKRAILIKKINTEYGTYLPNLLDEKTSLEDIRDISREINKSARERINAIILEEKIAEATKKGVEAQKELNELAVEESLMRAKGGVYAMTSKEIKKLASSGKNLGHEFHSASSEVITMEKRIKAARFELVKSEMRIESYMQKLSDLGIVTGETGGKTGDQTEEVGDYTFAVEDAAEATKEFTDEFERLNFALDSSSVPTGPIENIEEELEDASEVLEDFQGNLDRLYDKRQKLQEGFTQMGLILKSTFQDAFRPLEEGETRMEAFTDAFSRMLKQMIVDLLATAAAAALVAVAMTIAFGGVGAAGASIFGAGFEGGFGALFGKTFQGMGGLGFGGGFGNNNNGGMNIMSIIRGQDLLLVQERAGRNRNRSTGIGG
jgi:DNA-binding cell septation regulator SpoVG